jgi:hypothetical protein
MGARGSESGRTGDLSQTRTAPGERQAADRRGGMLATLVSLLVAGVAAAILAVGALVVGWLPLCEKAVGATWVGLTLVIALVLELARRLRRARASA